MKKCKICDRNLNETGSMQCGAIHEEYQKKRLKHLRKQIEAENISYGEIAELQSLAKYIDKGDVGLLEWAGVKE
jgi:hypothetical protein